MKYLTVILIMLTTGCSNHSKGEISWKYDNRTVIDNPVVEVIKAARGVPTGNTGRGFQVRRQTTWTNENMPKHWR